MPSKITPYMDPVMPNTALPLPTLTQTLTIAPLPGCSLAYTLAQLAMQQPGLWVMITEDMQSAYTLQQEIPWFLGDAPIPVALFPDWETLPYDPFSPHQDIISERLHWLSRLPQLKRAILIIAVQTLMQPVPPPSYVQAHSLVLAVGDTFDLSAKRSALEQAGYQCVRQVMTPGEFAVRGSIIDIYPMGASMAYRIDLLGDDIDSIRPFDPETQQSTGKVPTITLLPAREYPLDDDSITRFGIHWTQRFEHAHKSPILAAVEEQRAFPGLEYYLPLFFEARTQLLEHLPKTAGIVSIGDLQSHAQAFWQRIGERYHQFRHNREHPLLEPETLFASPEELQQLLALHPHLQIAHKPKALSLHHTALPTLTLPANTPEPLTALSDFLKQTPARVLFVCESPGRREWVLQHLARIQVTPIACQHWLEFTQGSAKTMITIAPLQQGAALAEGPWVVITENQLFQDRVLQQRRRKTTSQHAAGTLIRDISELALGDPVVHLEHGVGRYQGLTLLTLNGQHSEFVTLHYAGEDKLYVPVTALHMLSRYSSQDVEHAPLHRLSSDRWQKDKAKAAEKLRDVAAELLDVYAKREAQQGFAYPAPDAEYARFVDQFPFEETPDQALAIEQVLNDMQATRPMDRLLCGDVGFGKTEVALRAAYLAVQAHKQVAVLVPTTLLAQQHFNTFSDRFAEWPVKIALLSRFNSAEQQKHALLELTAGKVDIMIGTHSLLSKTVHFHNLGLLIIDEEHRFGVRHKEQLKAFRANVDILTMTATPIPRTLNMAMANIRDLSIIATPPARRLAVKTFVQPHSDALVREALQRELSRGGQVFYVHNSVETITRTAEHLQSLLPNARIAIGHGQLRERELEKIMADFYHNRYQILVCTTIIETGIDIPNANTMIIDRADTFGLAQLHQLRGRVGRSHHQAYTYLLTPPPAALTTDAQKRLQAISQADTLGAGFTLASHDLEIRGAGELLGEEQSGQIQAIGLTLYTELLERSVAVLKQGRPIDLQALTPETCDIDFHVSCLIPEDYLPDIQLRLECYKRIAHAHNQHELDEVKISMIDRFGLIPEVTQPLFAYAELRFAALPLGVKRIDSTPSSLKIEFNASSANVPTTRLMTLLQKHSGIYRLQGANTLVCKTALDTFSQRYQQVVNLLKQLSG